MNYPSDRFYLATHQWLQPLDADLWRVGITPYAVEQLGDLVYLQLPELETTLAAGEPIFVVESVKTASEVALPFSCEVIEIARHLVERPEQLQAAPLAETIVVVRALTSPSADQLLDAEAYARLIQASA